MITTGSASSTHFEPCSLAAVSPAITASRYVAVSVGVAVAQLPDEPITDLIKSADRALYRAKRAGRDRVVAA